MTGKAAGGAIDSLQRLADSLRHVVAEKQSLIEAAATRTVHITTAAPSVIVPAGHWWDSALLGGAIAAIAGMLTPLIVAFFERRTRRDRVIQVLGTELGILQFRMVSVCISLAQRLNLLDDALLTTLRRRITPRLETGDLKTVRRMIDLLKGLTPAQLATWQVLPPGAVRALVLRQYDLPYLESSLPDLHLLRPATQSLLFQLRGSLALFNQHVDEALRYHWLTFETLQDQNRDAVEQNIVTTRRHAFDMAMRVASTIASVLDESDFAAIEPSQAQVDPPPEGSDTPPPSAQTL
jgi:hypothetical protein